MNCPKCNCKKVSRCEIVETNAAKKAMSMFGAGLLGIFGIIALPVPGLHGVGIGCLAGASCIGKASKGYTEKSIITHTCTNCGHVWTT